MEYVNNIYQRGAGVTCARPPMTERGSCKVIHRQVVEKQEAPAMFLQTWLKKSARVSVSVLHLRSKKNDIKDLNR